MLEELTYDFFVNFKVLQESWGYNKTQILWSDILKFCKEKLFAFYYKTSYQIDYNMINMRNKQKKMIRPEESVSEHKRKDLGDLKNKNLIPYYYVDFYNTILNFQPKFYCCF